MGRIKTKLVKRITREVIKRYSDNLKTNFEENKQIIKGLVDTKSKKIKNTIAGYATRCMRAQKQK